ncbi:hypothetical protein AMS68_002342 [Peltaster fructicola]|uniref:AAA+ ATPase domain-containing protein n=1 Tax=Peltaster fructicola TaxID=286661 RepID=A0A6H0XQB2_9PEZI|nr:hypothetical protein AMS68_002342 [Peltaster fructicola]
MSCSSDVASQLVESTEGKTGDEGKPAKNDIVERDANTFGRLNAPMAANLEVEAIVNATYSLAGQNLPVFAGSKSELAIQFADPHGHAYMDSYVDKLADTVGADVVRIDANDFSDLTEEYVGQGNDSPGTFSTLAHEVFDGQSSVDAIAATASATVSSQDPFEEEENDEEEEEEDEDNEDESDEPETNSHGQKIKSVQDLLKSNFGNLERGLSRIPVAFSFAIPAGAMSGRNGSRRKKDRQESDYVQWDDARLSAVLEQLVDAPQTKCDAESTTRSVAGAPSTIPLDLANIAWSLGKQHAVRLQNQSQSPTIHPNDAQQPRTIIHVKDLNDICRSKLGEVIITRLAKVVQKRRRLGEQVMIIGSSTTIDRTAANIEDSPFISCVVPNLAESLADKNDMPAVRTAGHGYHRIKEINVRHIGSMLRRLQPDQGSEEIDTIIQDPAFSKDIRLLGERALSQEVVHRLVLTAIGLARTYTRSEAVNAFHIELAASILSYSEHLTLLKATALGSRIRARFGTSNLDTDKPGKTGRERIEKIKQNCNSHEARLLGGVVDSQNIKTGFDDVHVAPDTIEALKTLTSLSLLRPDAFKYGILAKDNLSGLMLYGPPGTGKTLLAKAVAKESKATVLEVSGAQVYEKYVGEGEKMVRAVFTLAKKLSPCVVFIDEADALFGTRNSASNRSTHRELINQFLREWDGMDDHKVFIMVATNRPFDVDDAVLRRLPRRLLVDLPVAKDREDILGIHLRDEDLDPAVALPKLAAQTPLYSGSDLKNLCVAAALAAVREENALAAKHAEDEDFALPEKRTLYQRHFDKGLQEISASISEDMSSLNAIRKFDEQYGDRKGRRKKASYGFGALDAAVDENAARVRQGP